jgi:hypothetical protein
MREFFSFNKGKFYGCQIISREQKKTIYGWDYELAVEIKGYRIVAKAYTDANNKKYSVASLEEWGVHQYPESKWFSSNLKFNIKSFETAKRVARKWLKDAIKKSKKRRIK